MLVPPHYLVSTAFKKMRWKDEFRKWLPKLSIVAVSTNSSYLQHIEKLLIFYTTKCLKGKP